LFGQETLQGLVEALDLAAGLGVIGRGVDAADAEVLELGFDDDFAPPGLAAEDSCVVAQPSRWITVCLSGFIEDLDYIGGLDGRESDRGHDQARVVVDQVQDLDLAAVGEQPVSGVGLPHLIGEVRLEALERRARSLPGLRRNQASPAEHAPDGCH